MLPCKPYYPGGDYDAFYIPGMGNTKRRLGERAHGGSICPVLRIYGGASGRSHGLCCHHKRGEYGASGGSHCGALQKADDGEDEQDAGPGAGRHCPDRHEF